MPYIDDHPLLAVIFGDGGKPREGWLARNWDEVSFLFWVSGLPMFIGIGIGWAIWH